MTKSYMKVWKGLLGTMVVMLMVAMSASTGCEDPPSGNTAEPGIAIRAPIEEPDIEQGACTVAQTETGADITCADGSTAHIDNGQTPNVPVPEILTEEDSDTGCMQVFYQLPEQERTTIGKVCPPSPTLNTIFIDTHLTHLTGGYIFGGGDFIATNGGFAHIPVEVTNPNGEWYHLDLNRGGTCKLLLQDDSSLTFDILTSPTAASTKACAIEISFTLAGGNRTEKPHFVAGFDVLNRPNVQGGGFVKFPKGTWTMDIALASFPARDNPNLINAEYDITLMGTFKRLGAVP